MREHPRTRASPGENLEMYAGTPHLRRVTLHLQGPHRKQVSLPVEEGAWIED